MRMESLRELRNRTPNRFDDLIEHYDLLVHGMSGRYKVLAGRETATQIKYQADLLKSIDESHDSDDGNKGKSREAERAEDEDDQGEMAEQGQ